jgi:cytochrome c553
MALALLPALAVADTAPGGPAPGGPAPGGPALDGKQIVLHGNANGALPCAACHGVNGAGKAAIGAPALAGLPAPVIEADLAGLAKGNGSEIMASIAQALTPAEVKAVAAYFASLPKQ